MDNRSESVLALICPDLAALVRQAQKFLSPQGVNMCVYQGLRTAGQQTALWNQGRTLPGQVVTNAKAGYSNHNYGLAVDIVPYLQGTSGALNWEVSTPAFQAMVRALKNQGLVYGGDWQHFPDNDHFQSPTIPPSPTAAMLADYNAGRPLTEIWANAAAHKYLEASA